jgi:hypothetical protein
MNPNLNFGQAVKGSNMARGAGLIDARHLIFVPDDITLLAPSRAWTKNNQAAATAWFAAFLDWMTTSPNG